MKSDFIETTLMHILLNLLAPHHIQQNIDGQKSSTLSRAS